MRRLFSLASLTFIVAGVLVGAQVVNSAPAAALCGHSSLSPCNPEMAWIAPELVGAGTGVVGSAGTAAGVSGTAVSATGSAVATGGGVLAILGGLLGFNWAFGDSDIPQIAGQLPGWSGGDNYANGVSATMTTAPAYLSRAANTVSLVLAQNVITGTHSLSPSQFNTAWASAGFNANYTLTIFYTDSTSTGTTVSASTMFRGSGTPATANATATITATTNATKNFSHVKIGLSGGDVATWYPVGHPAYVEPAPGGYIGTVEGTYTCTGASGSSVIYRSYPMTAEDAGNIEAPPFNCPAGMVLTDAVITWVPVTGARVPLTDYSADEWIRDIPAEFPGCLGTVCEISLWRLVSGTRYENCGPGAIGCEDWWADAAKVEHYQCHYGAYTVDLTWCTSLRKPGKVSTNVKVETNADGQTKVTPIVSLNPEDFPDAEVCTSIACAPASEPGPAPTCTAGSTCEELPTPSQCWPSGWGAFNPLSWVYMPVKCVLVWAFVPNVTVETFAPIVTALGVSPLGEAQVFFVGITDALQIEGRDCVTLIDASPDVFVGAGFEVNTCDEILAAVGPTARAGLGWLAILLGAFGAFAVVSSAFDVKSGIRAEAD